MNADHQRSPVDYETIEVTDADRAAGVVVIGLRRVLVEQTTRKIYLPVRAP